MKRISLLVLCWGLLGFGPALSLAFSPSDDAHNHDGSHPDGPTNCGSNYMLPGEIARLGSHSFMILGVEDGTHIIAEHRSGTPPHNYQYLFRVRLDPSEMQDVKDLLKDAKTLPAFTTIYFDADGKQLDRTFFCNQDLAKIFGVDRKRGDDYEKLFPIRAALQANPDHEGGFQIEKSVVPGKFLTLERADFELTVARYLPAYLAQDLLRKSIKRNAESALALFKDAPLYFNEPKSSASRHKSYMSVDGLRADKAHTCPKNYYLKSTAVPETIHTFMLMGEIEPNIVLAVHYYDEAPQNFQTALKLHFSPDALKVYESAKAKSKTPPLFQTRLSDGTNQSFCMEEIRKLAATPSFSLRGVIYGGSILDDYKLGSPTGEVVIPSKDITVLVNRKLESFMNPIEVAADVKRGGKAKPAAKSNSVY
jgi:hypothetical protein